ncbi:unnamed protein product [Somion occarium]|uniref:Clu domain-containing protein n=1 Tax=Somion occarium TaxID=3059160 RepID=A0ABP1DPA5_9APHY
MGTRSKSRKGLSSSVRVRAPNGFGRVVQEVRLNTQMAQRREEIAKKRYDHLTSLTFEEREVFFNDDATGATPMDVDEDLAFDHLPPGEEGFFASNAGGEEELCRTFFLSNNDSRKRKDVRTRRDRRLLQNKEWAEQMLSLVDAFLDWQMSRSTEVHDTAQFDDWEVTTVDFFSRSRRRFNSGPSVDRANVVLIRNGYIGSAPRSPTVAIGLQVLEAYHEMHAACPRFSIQAQVRALCRLHKVHYMKYLASQFRIAYDVYLAIRRCIDVRANAALHRDIPNWRMKNACAACLYALENEDPLTYALQVSMDGNQSLKLVDDHFRRGPSLADTRSGISDIWLNPEEVDIFKNEVGKPQQSQRNTGDAHDIDDDIDWVNIADHTDSADVTLSTDECVKRWRNAGPEARKKMFALFAVTGVFVCLCRHGQLLAICDMIRSGELMKYPLAIVDKLMRVLGVTVQVAYDIACAFMKILERSSLGDRVQQQGLRGIVPAFHGHAHNRLCQVDWHPLYVAGSGKEDFEGCERVFSQSNALALTTRFSSPFHRHQAIDEFFKSWAFVKHAELANFIHNNYRQALKIVAEDSATLRELCTRLKLNDEDFEQYLQEERAYLKNLVAESPEVAFTVEYMEALLRLDGALYHAKREYQNLDARIIREGLRGRAITNIKTRYVTTYTRYVDLHEHVRRIEEVHGIVRRWTKDSEEYKNGLVVLTERKYRNAIDTLERLLLQRLLELTKLSMSGTGYKMREKITKALKTRATAIKKALEEYNRRAAELNPPRPSLSWSDVVDMVSVAEFDLLRDARQDVRLLAWAQPAQRRAMNLYFNIKRAEEEIKRLNVEIRRLLTHMVDEHVDYYRTIRDNMVPNPPLAYELSLRWRYSNAVNTELAYRLQQTSELPGFTGTLRTGHRVGRSPILADGILLPPWVSLQTQPTEGFDASGNELEDDEELGMEGVGNEDEANVLIDYIDRLGLHSE